MIVVFFRLSFYNACSKPPQKENPKPSHQDPEDRFPTWHFESHGFTLMALWTKFLVQATERIINGSATGVYDLQLDKMDREWTDKLPPVDYIIISTGHWFFRELYMHQKGQLLGCIYCSNYSITSHSPAFGIQKAFRKALHFINDATEPDQNILTVLRTFSPAHFENGTWNGGGYCNRTRPFEPAEVSLAGTDWEIRNAQVDEMKKMKAECKRVGRRFEVLDITRAMMMRPDAHPDTNWNNEWMRGYSDCVHWCLPGAVDTWNDMLLILLDNYLLKM